MHKQLQQPLKFFMHFPTVPQHSISNSDTIHNDDNNNNHNFKGHSNPNASTCATQRTHSDCICTEYEIISLNFKKQINELSDLVSDSQHCQW